MMFRFLPMAPIAGGVAALELPMDDWIRLGLEVALGVTAVVLGSLRPRERR